MKIQRTHDSFYLQENRYRTPKHLHLEIIRMMGESLGTFDSDIRICDFGCAAGEFEFALREYFPSATIEGFDILEQLLEKARNEVSSTVKFTCGSIVDKTICEQASADVSLSTGVLSIFDQFETPLDNLIYWTKNGGSVYVHSLFNNDPVDVFVKYCLSKNYGMGVLEAGWNIFSKESVGGWLAKHPRVSSFEFYPFSLNLDLQKNDNDPARSWTFEDRDGHRQITNGLCLLQPHSILRIGIKN